MSDVEPGIDEEPAEWSPPFDFDEWVATGGKAVPEGDTYVIDGDEGAHWYTENVARLASKEARLEKVYRARRAPHDRWRDRRIGPIRRARQRAEVVLKSYGLAERRRTEGKTKSIDLPFGTISTRGSEHRVVELVDEDLVIKALDTLLPEADAKRIAPLVRKVNVTELRKTFKAVEGADGEWSVLGPGDIELDGVSVTKPNVTASVALVEIDPLSEEDE